MLKTVSDLKITNHGRNYNKFDPDNLCLSAIETITKTSCTNWSLEILKDVRFRDSSQLPWSVVSIIWFGEKG